LPNDNDLRALDDFFTEDGVAATDGYGEILLETTANFDVPGNLTLSASPTFFSVFGRSYDGSSTLKNGSWFTFVAPQTGNYTILIGGRGQFSAGYAIRPSPRALAPGSTFRPADWIAVCRAQIPFLFAADGYPSEGFATLRKNDDGTAFDRTDVSPATTRLAIEAKLTDFDRSLEGESP
jgi:hypothetical protein